MEAECWSTSMAHSPYAQFGANILDDDPSLKVLWLSEMFNGRSYVFDHHEMNDIAGLLSVPVMPAARLRLGGIEFNHHVQAVHVSFDRVNVAKDHEAAAVLHFFESLLVRSRLKSLERIHFIHPPDHFPDPIKESTVCSALGRALERCALVNLKASGIDSRHADLNSALRLGAGLRRNQTLTKFDMRIKRTGRWLVSFFRGLFFGDDDECGGDECNNNRNNTTLRHLEIHCSDWRDNGVNFYPALCRELCDGLRNRNYTLETIAFFDINAAGRTCVEVNLLNGEAHALLAENRRLRREIERIEVEKEPPHDRDYVLRRAIDLRVSHPEVMYALLRSDPAKFVQGEIQRHFAKNELQEQLHADIRAHFLRKKLRYGRSLPRRRSPVAPAVRPLRRSRPCYVGRLVRTRSR